MSSRRRRTSAASDEGSGSENELDNEKEKNDGSDNESILTEEDTQEGGSITSGDEENDATTDMTSDLMSGPEAVPQTEESPVNLNVEKRNVTHEKEPSPPQRQHSVKDLIEHFEGQNEGANAQSKENQGEVKEGISSEGDEAEDTAALEGEHNIIMHTDDVEVEKAADEAGGSNGGNGQEEKDTATGWGEPDTEVAQQGGSGWGGSEGAEEDGSQSQEGSSEEGEKEEGQLSRQDPAWVPKDSAYFEHDDHDDREALESDEEGGMRSARMAADMEEGSDSDGAVDRRWGTGSKKGRVRQLVDPDDIDREPGPRRGVDAEKPVQAAEKGKKKKEVERWGHDGFEELLKEEEMAAKRGETRRPMGAGGGGLGYGGYSNRGSNNRGRGRFGGRRGRFDSQRGGGRSPNHDRAPPNTTPVINSDQEFPSLGENRKPGPLGGGMERSSREHRNSSVGNYTADTYTKGFNEAASYAKGANRSSRGGRQSQRGFSQRGLPSRGDQGRGRVASQRQQHNAGGWGKSNQSSNKGWSNTNIPDRQNQDDSDWGGGLGTLQSQRRHQQNNPSHQSTNSTRQQKDDSGWGGGLGTLESQRTNRQNSSRNPTANSTRPKEDDSGWGGGLGTLQSQRTHQQNNSSHQSASSSAQVPEHPIQSQQHHQHGYPPAPPQQQQPTPPSGWAAAPSDTQMGGSWGQESPNTVQPQQQHQQHYPNDALAPPLPKPMQSQPQQLEAEQQSHSITQQQLQQLMISDGHVVQSAARLMEESGHSVQLESSPTPHAQTHYIAANSNISNSSTGYTFHQMPPEPTALQALSNQQQQQQQFYETQASTIQVAPTSVASEHSQRESLQTPMATGFSGSITISREEAGPLGSQHQGPVIIMPQAIHVVPGMTRPNGVGSTGAAVPMTIPVPGQTMMSSLGAQTGVYSQIPGASGSTLQQPPEKEPSSSSQHQSVYGQSSDVAQVGTTYYLAQSSKAAMQPGDVVLPRQGDTWLRKEVQERLNRTPGESASRPAHVREEGGVVVELTAGKGRSRKRYTEMRDAAK